MVSLGRRLRAHLVEKGFARAVLQGTALLSLFLLLTGCLGPVTEGEAEHAQTLASQLSYRSERFTFTLNSDIDSIVPVKSPEGLLSVEVAPTLPLGIRLDSATGALSGRPAQLAEEQAYRFNVRTQSGSAVIVLKLSVIDHAPTFIALSAGSASGSVGVPFGGITLVGLAGGAITECSSLPPLPQGLAFGSNCRIEGTPTQAAFAAPYLITATNSGGSSSAELQLTISDAPPALSRASSPIELQRGIAIQADPLALTRLGGAVLGCAVTPALPNGITLSQDCQLSGKPTQLASQINYVFTATNPGGSTSFAAALRVSDLAPTLSYSGGLREYIKDSPIAVVQPRTNGAVIDSCVVTPNLPSGLSLSSQCEISGKPTVVAAARDYIFTATNTAGSAQGSLRIHIKDVAPVLDYGGTTSFQFFVGANSVTVSPRSNTGGAITQCYINTALPSGLTLSSGCVIAGTPTDLSAEKPYVLSAYNSGGSSSITVRLRVSETVPSISYPLSVLSLNRGVSMTPLVPSNSGGPVRSCSVSPTLPAGLILGSDCVLGGAATGVSPQTSYEITAANSAGFSARRTLSIAVNVAPLQIIYPNSILSGVQNAAFSTQTPVLSGGEQGTVTACSATPPLPSGLSLHPTTCVLSGMPTIAQPQTTHTVTASGPGGPAQTNITLTILEMPPSISYSPSTVSLSPGESFSRSVINTGGAVTGCAAAPAPPAGFTLHPDCRIEGASTVPVSVGLLVTASNSGGTSSASFTITVSEVAPDISYAVPSYTWVKDQPLTPVSVNNAGGPISNCTVTPALPNGLIFSASNCQISGTPIVVSAASTYVVTATNSGGVDTFALSAEVQDSVPQFSFPQSPVTLVQGVTLTSPLVPVSTGAPITNCSALSGLPSGLLVDSQCRISGTPTAPQVLTTATLRALSLNGSSEASLAVRVLDPPPALSLAITQYAWPVGISISPISVTNSGGPIENCEAIGPLPSGVTIDSSDCTLAGTPTTLQSAASYRVRATNPAGSSSLDLTLAVVDSAPQLSFPASVFRLTRDQASGMISPANAGGGVTSCDVDKPLPAGLSYSPDCRISGTPSALAALDTYTLTGTNAWGSDPAVIQIEVVDPVPVISFSPSSRVFEKGTLVAAFSPGSVGGPISSCAISPALPAGLTFNASTCEISGTPTVVSAVQSYTVTATNTGGPGQTSLVIEVRDLPPVIDYPATPLVYQQGQGVNVAAPANTGGAIVQCSVTPDLPVGFTLNPTTCAITGTAMSVSASTSYTLSATNSGGSATDTLQIEVSQAAPLIAFAPPARTYPVNVAITAIFPLNSGGSIASCGISAALPAGLTFDPSNCGITGTPTVAAGPTAFVITASNAAGEANATLTLEVLDLPPIISYSPASRAFTKGLSDSAAVISSGGPFNQCDVTPALPAGLSLSSSCLISGTAEGLFSPTTFTVTASNGTQTGSTLLVLSVRDAVPLLTYSPSVRTLTLNSEIVAPGIVPTQTGGVTTACGVAPPLPAGLTLAADCTLTGTPTEIRALDQYNITASNSGGHALTSLSIEVRDVPPQISYGSYSHSFTQDADIPDLIATNTGGAITHCSSSPTLPAGLGMDEECLISGRPIDAMTATPFVITAFNSGGTSSRTLTLSVDVGPPDIIFSPSARILGVTLSMPAILPINNGGAITGCSVSGSLPPGLTLSNSCMVAGVPTAVGGPWTVFVTASNARGESEPAELTLTVTQIPPVLVYPQNNFIFTRDTPISDVAPSLSGGSLESCSVSPALPAGLSFNPGTCVLSGTPTVQSDQQTYLISASNSVGSSIQTLTIRVNDILPAVTFNPTTLSYLVGSAISPPIVSNTGGGILGCSISPGLPSGLLMNSQCQLSGTPLQETAQTVYTVTTVNSGGSSTSQFTMTVLQQAPQLQFFPTSYSFSVGGTINDVTPFNTGGTIQNCTVDPALPDGLTLGATTCVISGTPTVAAPSASYTVTASNGTGSSARTIAIQVATGPPVLSFNPSSLTLTASISMSPLSPVNAGGAVTACNVSPSLPVGISFASDCRLTGTALAPQSAVLYTLTGANSYGVSSAQLTIAVAEGPPVLTYNVTEYVFTQNVPITPFGATNTGGAISTCSALPGLPAALTISNNCVVSGTPTGTLVRTSFTVQASNSAGQDAETIYITVNAGAPVLALAQSSVVATLRTAISPIEPSNSGGAITSCGISPALPAGLSVNQQCRITGSPTLTSPERTYTVTASNTSGNSSAEFTLRVRNQPLLIYDSRINIGGVESSAASPSQNIWKMTLDGVDKLPLTFVNNGSTLVKENKQATVDTDGKIFYVSEVSQTGLPNSWANAQRAATDLWSVLTSGNELSVLTAGYNNAAFNISDPSPQPSAGSLVTFRSTSHLTTPTSTAVPRSANIFVVNKTGGGWAAVTRNSSTTTAANAHDSREPSWRPDGSEIAFTSRTAVDGTWNSVVGAGVAAASYNLWRASSIGPYPLTLILDGNGREISDPVYSPDGQKILFSARLDIGMDVSNCWNIFVINRDGTGLSNLTSEILVNRDSYRARWSADGSEIVFLSKMNVAGTPAASYNVWKMSADGSNQVALTTNTLSLRDADRAGFSPDGDYIAFSSRQPLTPSGAATTSFNIWVMRSDGTQMSARTTIGATTGKDSNFGRGNFWYIEP